MSTWIALLLTIPVGYVFAIIISLIFTAIFGLNSQITHSVAALSLFFIGPGLAFFSVKRAVEALQDQARNRKYEAERRRQEAEARKRAAEAEVERKRQQELAHKNQQREFYTSLIDLGSGSFALFEAMPNHLLTAEELLDQAERDFEEGAFAPFWDSVERAAMKLGHFDDGVRTIKTNAERHTDLAKRYEGKAPPFPIVLDSVTGMAAANTTNDRMRGVVRTAQRNFQFATIFEQRKTNQLLVAGFTNLAQALDGMGRRIASSIDDLGEQISDMSSTLDSSLQNLGSRLDTTLTAMHDSSVAASERMASRIDGLHESFQKDAAGRAERHQKALAMLDNIQRRRKPMPPGLRDGEY